MQQAFRYRLPLARGNWMLGAIRELEPAYHVSGRKGCEPNEGSLVATEWLAKETIEAIFGTAIVGVIRDYRCSVCDRRYDVMLALSGIGAIKFFAKSAEEVLYSVP